MDLITLERIDEALCAFGDVIHSGSHPSDSGKCCVVELANYLRGNKWSDSPAHARMFDLRSINDLQVSQRLRTKYMTKLLVAYQGSLEWSDHKIEAVLDRLITLTACRLKLNPEADALLAMAYSNISWPVYASAKVAEAGAMAVNDFGRTDRVYKTLCNLWLEAPTFRWRPCDES